MRRSYYVLSNLGKNGELSNNFNYSVITDVTDKLLFENINFDDILYNLLDEKLGKYSRKIKKLGNLYFTSPYYRFNYVFEGKKYKLQSIELKQKF